MSFVDEINFYVSSGKSGDGLFSFSNKKIPNGGNGGKGGGVYLFCDKKVSNFYHLKFNSIYKAENGVNGKKNNKTGKSGNDIFLRVPEGTIVYDGERNIFLGELLNDGEKLLLVSSGKPGYGNLYLKNKLLNLNDLKFGSKAIIKFIHLELNLLADIGLLGFPNVGKSSFICVASDVISKIGEYKFTTLIPVLGCLKKFKNNVVIADIPGIISLSSEGCGLGFKFLKHLLKTKLLFHFIDLSFVLNEYCIYKGIYIIQNELKKYDYLFLKKYKWLILNKNDLIHDLKFFTFFIFLIKRYQFMYFFNVSSKKKNGFKKLMFNINEYFFKSRRIYV